MYHHLNVAVLALALAAPGLVAKGQAPASVRPAPLIEVAICLDTSGSMSGLIDSARAHLWSIVNDLALARPTPRLRVALLTFGNNGHDQARGWVKIDSAFTEDLDLISKQLFALTTNGGTELVGRVVHAAVTDLSWESGPDSLRLILVAGNESADQDQEIPYGTACRSAIERGVQINAIYCGNASDQIAPAWRDVARLADGHFAAIDHNQVAIAAATPFDARIEELSVDLNRTYVAWGEQGKEGAANQAVQDANAARTGVAAERAATKAGALYRCAWDLVDACQAGSVKLEEIATEDLPAEMKALEPGARQAYIDGRRAERERIQQEVNKLGAERARHLAEEQRKAAAAGASTFGEAVRTAIRAQAQARGFSFAP